MVVDLELVNEPHCSPLYPPPAPWASVQFFRLRRGPLRLQVTGLLRLSVHVDWNSMQESNLEQSVWGPARQWRGDEQAVELRQREHQEGD